MRQTTWTRVLPSLALALGAAVATAGCGVTVGPAYPGYYSDYPPDAYIATAEPFYYDGYPSYWYGGRWYYRNGGRWNHYDREPHGLYQHRMHAAPGRRSYERSGGRHTSHAAHSGRSGGRR